MSVLQRFSKPHLGVLWVALLVGSLCTALAWADDQEVMSGTAAATIRSAGYPCAHVIQMDRLKAGASDGSSRWEVRCNSGRFRVKFNRDTGSEVVPLD